ncbi:hypothetical protein [Psychrobacillus sp.]|uniref:hypothetical protein n=1 Tax=Psychrobacillus sp. TaxID=1871623 RepID=UPI0028BDD2B9|nr:hypothetical protein [Psychrobacillus sp.]
MQKTILFLLFILILPLSACGVQRESNEPPTPETQLDSQQKNKDLGNEEVNKENDVGIPKEKETNNDQTFEGAE